VLRAAGARRVVDLGCGSGNDVVRLRAQGFVVVGLDFSGEAVTQATAKVGRNVFVVADVARPLPFATSSLDAVMSNVALHMFSDAVTRAVFAEVARVVAPGGLFVFHLNSVEDAPLRRRLRPPVSQLEENYVLEADGQTMHFFSEEYLRKLLAGWVTVHLEPVAIPRLIPCKKVWRCVATSPPKT
jgi:SAM-dependent methyltransferase